MRTRRVSAALCGAALTLTLAACGGTDEGSATASESTSSPSSSGASAGTEEAAGDEGAAVTAVDPWIKSAEKGGMTALFADLTNDGSTEVVVTGASSPAASTVELHETTQGSDGSSMMKPVEGGFTVPAGESHELEPGGDHVMLMGLTKALKPGERVTVELQLEDGSTSSVEAIVKDFAGADENYGDSESEDSMDGMDDMDHDDMGDMDGMDHGADSPSNGSGS